MENNRRNRLEMIPSADALMSYVFRALQYLGGSGANKEIDSAVERILDLPDDVVSESHLGSFTQTELSYRVAWAKTKLKKKGIITNSARSVWSILPQFQQYTNLEDIAVSLLMDQEDAEAETAAEMKTEQDWLSNVSERLHSMDPYAFERLIQRLLRECGFSSVTVTRKSGDGGIDAILLELVNDVDDLRVACIRAVLLECKSKNCNLCILHRLVCLDEILHTALRNILAHIVIYSSAGEDDLAMISKHLRLVCQVIRVYADAVSADKSWPEVQLFSMTLAASATLMLDAL